MNIDKQVPISIWDHPNNVTVGKGRIIWETRDGGFWALPGQNQTTNRYTAIAAATWIDRNAQRIAK